MSVMEIVSQVKTLPAIEQTEFFKEIHRLEEEQKLLAHFGDLSDQPMENPTFEIPEDQVDYVLDFLERKGIRLP